MSNYTSSRMGSSSSIVIMLMLMLMMLMWAAEAAGGGGNGNGRRGIPRWAAEAGTGGRVEQVVGGGGGSSTGAAPTTPPILDPKPDLEYYVQVDTAGPDVATLVPPLDSNSTHAFGEVQAFALNITAGYSWSSQLLGVVRGFTVQTSYSPASYDVEVEVVVYDDGAGTNGTLSLQGLVAQATNELAVVGGSGSFRGASGYDIVTFVNASSSTVFVFHHALYFL